jgi:hypothetical protein
MVETTLDFAKAAMHFAKHGEHRWIGDDFIAAALGEYFKKRVNNGQIPQYGRHGGVHFTQYIAKYLDDAWEFFRTSGDIDASNFRRLYEEKIKGEVLCLTEISYAGPNRIMDILNLASLAAKISGEDWVEDKVKNYFFAQDTVLEQQFQRFVRLVYKQGLSEMINASKSAGMSGTFGSIDVRTMCTAGRVVMTFAKSKTEAETETEESFTFIGEEKEMQGKRFGMQSVYVDLGTAISMINEVINNWPSADQPDCVKKRNELFKDNSKVGFGVW